MPQTGIASEVLTAPVAARNRGFGSPWLALALVVVLIWFGGISQRVLTEPDEGRYAEIPREMLASGDWVTPRLDGLPYFEKPPLQYWATAAAYSVLGISAGASRLWTIGLGFAGLVLLLLAGANLYGAATGRLAALLLAGSPLYVLVAHINTLDMGVAFFLTASLCAILKAQQAEPGAGAQRRAMLWAAAAAALGVLSKGLIALVIPGLALIAYSITQRDFALWRRLSLWRGALLLLVIAAPWFLLVSSRNPGFAHFFFIHEHFERFATKVHGRFRPWWYFIPFVLIGVLPWAGIVARSALAVWRHEATQQGFRGGRFALLWAVVIVVFFSLSDSKLSPYIVPIVAPLALVTARALADGLISFVGEDLMWTAATGLGALATAAFVGYAPQAQALRVEYGAMLPWVAAAGVLWLSGAGLAWLCHERRAVVGAIACIGVCSLGALQALTLGTNTLANERSGYPLAQSISTYVDQTTSLYAIGTFPQSVAFYLRRPLVIVGDPGELETQFDPHSPFWIRDLNGFAERWRKEPRAVAIVDEGEMPRLRALGIPMQVVFTNSQLKVVTKPAG
jgi:4-amino-4-deoxy-L-arabinose transferase-like glycosyltransferase